jgi:ribonuclease HI
MQFWWRNVWYNTPFDFRQRASQATLVTDAAKDKWGAVLWCGDTSLRTYGSFSKDLRADSCSSNRRETTAVLLALTEFQQLLQQQQIRALTIKSDNMVTVFNLQRQGASESLAKETKAIFSLLVKLDIRISVMHVPGVENVEADALSRMDEVGDYELEQGRFEEAVKSLGVVPTIDLFANDRNTKCCLFLALPGQGGSGAAALDAFRFRWTDGLPYVFPPVQIIPRVLQKVWMERARVVMVVPEWPSRPWWNLWRMGVKKEVVLGYSEQALKAGPALARNQTKLPPGRFLMAIVCYE